MWLNIIWAKWNSSKCSQRSSPSAVRDLWGGLQGFCRVSRFLALHVQCYQLIFADQKLNYRLRIIADSCTLSSLLLLHLVARVSIFSGKLFALHLFSVTVPVSVRSFGWFPRSRVVMDTSLQFVASGTPLTFKAPLPKLICLWWVLTREFVIWHIVME